MLKRLTAFFVSFTLFISLFPPMGAKAEVPDAEIKLGDYIVLGRYNNKPIIWRCVDIDENGPLMLSDKVLTYRAFDAPGENDTYSDGRVQPEISYPLIYLFMVPIIYMDYIHVKVPIRAIAGSNVWESSDIRSWLNSTAPEGSVEWLDNTPPDKQKYINADMRYRQALIECSPEAVTDDMGLFYERLNAPEYYNFYDQDEEKGFLADGNFTELERSFIKTVTQKCLVDETDGPYLAVGGSGDMIYRMGEYYEYQDSPSKLRGALKMYDTAYYHYVEDKVFLLDVEQVDRMRLNSEVLGEKYWKSTSFLLRTPCCVEYYHDYLPHYDEAHYVLSFSTSSSYDFGMSRASSVLSPIRPAFYLDTSLAKVISGSGSYEDPYILTDKLLKTTVTVIDYKTGEPVAGATVSRGTDNSVTDDEGKATIQTVDFGEYTISVSKEGYTDYEGTINVSAEENEETVYLKKGIAINSVTVTLPDGGVRDLLTDSGFIVDNEDEQEYTITAKVDWNNKEGKKGTVALVGAKSKKRIPFDGNGKLTKKLGKEFEKGEKVYVEATSEETGESDEEMLYAELEEIADKLRKGAQEYKLPTLQGPKIDDDIPILGGMGFKFDLKKLSESVNVSIKDRKVIIKIGKGKTLEDHKKLPKMLNWDPKSFKGVSLLGSKKADLEIFGKFEIPIDILKKESEFSGTVGLALGGNRNKEMDGFAPIADIQGQFAVGVVPVVLKLKIGAGFEAEGGVSATKWNFSDAKPSFSITPQGTIRVSAGVGAAKVANACVYGQGDLQIQINIISKEPAQNILKPELTLSLGAEVEAGPFQYEKRLYSTKFPKENQLNQLVNLQSIGSEEFKLIGRDYLKNSTANSESQEQSISLMSETELPARYAATVEENAFPNTYSKPLVIGDEVYLLYQQDDQNRRVADGLKLVYVKQSGTEFDKETAAAIEDDGTMDGNFDAASSGEHAFVIWEDSKTVFGVDDIDFDEYAASTEISVSKFNPATGEWGETVTLTNNNIADHSLVIAVRDDKAVAAWISNSESDILGIRGTNNIHYAFYQNGEWGTVHSINNVGMVTSIDVGWHYEEAYLCFDKDRDGDINTADKAVFIKNLSEDGEIEQMTSDSNSRSGQLVHLYGYEGLKLAYINAEDNIEVTGYITSPAVNRMTIETQEVEGYGIKAIDGKTNSMTGGYSALMWLETSEEGGYNQLCGAYFYGADVMEEGKKISLLGIGGDNGFNIKNFNAVIDNNGRVYVSYLEDPIPQIVNSETGRVTRGARKLKVYSYAPHDWLNTELKILQDSITWDEQAYARGEEIPFFFDVENIHEMTYNATGFYVRFYQGDRLIHEQDVQPEGIYHVFPHRQPVTVKAVLPPNLISGQQDIIIELDPILSGPVRSQPVTIGLPVLTIKEVYAENKRGAYYLNSEVQNVGGATAYNFVIEICEDQPDGNVIYSENVNSLEPLGKVNIRHRIDKGDIVFSGEVKKYYVRLRPRFESDLPMYFETVSMLGVINNPSTKPFEVVVTDGAFNEDGVFNTTICVQNNTQGDATKLLITALYDEDGRLVDIAFEDVSVLEGKSVFKTFEMNVGRKLDNYSQKAFLWDSMSDFKPAAAAFK